MRDLWERTQLNSDLTNIGYSFNNEISEINISNKTWKELFSFELKPGKFIMTFVCDFNKNGDGDRAISINNINNITGPRYGFITGKAVSFSDTVLSFTTTKNTTITLMGYQDSGKNLTGYPGAYVIQIK